MKDIINFLAVLFLFTRILSAQTEDPQPGEVFKEFFAKDFGMYKNGATSDSVEVVAHIDDLKYAVRAELSVIESHAHIGTSDRSFRINNGEKRAFYKPDVQNEGYCYHYQHYGRAATGFPLQELDEGDNTIKFYLGKQVCYGFNWPGWGNMGGVVLRVYYDPDKKGHPEGEIVAPLPNSEITDNLIIKVNIKENQRSIVRVDIIGNYYGFPFDGTEKFQNWHYHYQTGSANWHGQVDSRTRPPYNFYWNLKWIPDQDKPINLAARITDETGISFITQAVEGLTLKRNMRSVKMYICPNLPEKFQSRLSEKMSCIIPIPDDIDKAESALLQSITWPGHLEGKYKSIMSLNGTTLVLIENTENEIDRHHYYPSEVPINIRLLKKGENTFSIFSDTEGHMAEVYWPGPAILVAYKKGQ
jgi:hypothetical protein